jgi:hypothetical protein
MFNYHNFNQEQRKEVARFLFDISKAGFIGSITLNSISSQDIQFKILFFLTNFTLSLICFETAISLLKK